MDSRYIEMLERRLIARRLENLDVESKHVNITRQTKYAGRVKKTVRFQEVDQTLEDSFSISESPNNHTEVCKSSDQRRDVKDEETSKAARYLQYLKAYVRSPEDLEEIREYMGYEKRSGCLVKLWKNPEIRREIIVLLICLLIVLVKLVYAQILDGFTPL